jgi:hypothetical protein
LGTELEARWSFCGGLGEAMGVLEFADLGLRRHGFKERVVSCEDEKG